MKRILVIDDDESVREYLRRVLERAGYEVLEASNGREGVQIFMESRPDLVITDMIMPVMDGAETILHLRSQVNEPKIIAISGGDASTGAHVCLRVSELAGASRSLDKPLEKADLLETVRQLLSDEV